MAFVAKACSKKSALEPKVSGELGNNAESKGDKKTLTLISEEDSTAKALGYKHDASKVQAALKVKKNNTPGSKQNCANCAFYSKLDPVEDGGKCQLLVNGYVKSKGWCKSWSLKQG